jgi:hypothetical protein
MERAIEIFKEFPPTQYNTLIPVQTITQISPLHKVSINIVRISSNPDDKDVYRQGNLGLSLTKQALMKILAAVGGSIVDVKKIPPSSCEKCLEMAKATGKPSACADCKHNGDLAYEAIISVNDLAGGNRIFKASREFICEDERGKMTEAQFKQAYPFRAPITVVNPQNYYKYVRFKCRYMLHSLQFCVILS